MNVYQVTLTTVVKANNEEDARFLAEEIAGDIEAFNGDLNVEIEEVKEII